MKQPPYSHARGGPVVQPDRSAGAAQCATNALPPPPEGEAFGTAVRN